MSVTAALVSGGISFLINGMNSGAQKKANRIAAAESANASVRAYNETQRQKQVSQNLFETNVNNTLGNDFLSKLTGGADTSTLIESLSRGDTAFAKQLQGFEADAQQSIQNSVRGNQQAGQLASMQGGMNALDMLQANMQALQAEGGAVASQVTSGIRSDAGTGDNTQKMQEQANRLTLERLRKNIAYGNQSAMTEMQNSQLSASQSADQLRRQASITSKEMVEQMLSSFEEHKAQQTDYEISMEGHRKDANYLKSKATDKHADIINETPVGELKFWDDED